MTEKKAPDPWLSYPVRSEQEKQPDPVWMRHGFDMPRLGRSPDLPYLMPHEFHPLSNHRPLPMPTGPAKDYAAEKELSEIGSPLEAFYCTIDGVTAVSEDGIHWREISPHPTERTADGGKTWARETRLRRFWAWLKGSSV